MILLGSKWTPLSILQTGHSQAVDHLTKSFSRRVVQICEKQSLNLEFVRMVASNLQKVTNCRASMSITQYRRGATNPKGQVRGPSVNVTVTRLKWLWKLRLELLHFRLLEQAFSDTHDLRQPSSLSRRCKSFWLNTKLE